MTAKVFIALLLLFFFQGCLTAKKNSNIQSIEFVEIEKLSLGTDFEAAKKIDLPYEVVDSKDKNENLNLIYFNKSNSFQIATLSFSPVTKKLIYKKINLTDDNVNESKLDYFLKEKNQNLKFEIASYAVCGGHYLNPQKKYYNIDNGIILEYRPQDETVESITWTTPEIVERVIKDMQSCHKK